MILLESLVSRWKNMILGSELLATVSLLCQGRLVGVRKTFTIICCDLKHILFSLFIMGMTFAEISHHFNRAFSIVIHKMQRRKGPSSNWGNRMQSQIGRKGASSSQWWNRSDSYGTVKEFVEKVFWDDHNGILGHLRTLRTVYRALGDWFAMKHCRQTTLERPFHRKGTTDDRRIFF